MLAYGGVYAVANLRCATHLVLVPGASTEVAKTFVNSLILV